MRLLDLSQWRPPRLTERLRRAVVQNDIPAMDAALAQGHPVNGRCHGEDPGATALHIACSSQVAPPRGETAAAVNLLIARGADINARDGDGATPLHMAVCSHKDDITAALLRGGADPDIPTLSGHTPLHTAAHFRDTGIGAMLIRAGADVNAAARDGETPLHAATSGGDADMARLLIEAGADVHARNRHGKTPLEAAQGQAEELAAIHAAFPPELRRGRILPFAKPSTAPELSGPAHQPANVIERETLPPPAAGRGPSRSRQHHPDVER